jgi:hypothetical protein
VRVLPRNGIAVTIAETIHWRLVADELPDADTTVLVYAPGASDPVWMGYYDDVYWFAVGGEEYGNDEEIAEAVVAWAPMPVADML